MVLGEKSVVSSFRLSGANVMGGLSVCGRSGNDKTIIINVCVFWRIFEVDILGSEDAVLVVEETENALASPESGDTGNDDGRNAVRMVGIDIAMEVSGDDGSNIWVSRERLSPCFETFFVFPGRNDFVVDEVIAIGNMSKNERRLLRSLIEGFFQGGDRVEIRERRRILPADGFGADGHEECFFGFVHLCEIAEVFFEDLGSFEIAFRVVVFVDGNVVVSEHGQHGLREECAEIGDAAGHLLAKEIV